MLRACSALLVRARLTVEMTHDASPAAKQSVGAGDENRTRTVSLGSLSRKPQATCELVDLGTVGHFSTSGSELPLWLTQSGTRRARLRGMMTTWHLMQRA